MVVKSAPNVSIAAVASICPGQSTTLTASGGISYDWSTGDSGPSITDGAGSYSVTSYGSNGCSATAYTTITLKDAPYITLTNDGPLTCLMSSVTLTSTPGFSYYTYNGSSTTGSTLSEITQPGLYSVAVLGANGCSGTASTEVYSNISYPDASIYGNLFLCGDATATTLYASIYEGGNAFQWSTGSNASSISINVPGTYTLSVTNQAGCTASNSVEVTGCGTLNMYPADSYPDCVYWWSSPGCVLQYQNFDYQWVTLSTYGYFKGLCFPSDRIRLYRPCNSSYRPIIEGNNPAGLMKEHVLSDSNNMDFRFYPNPFNSSINLEYYSNKEEMITLEAFNNVGTLCATLKLNTIIGFGHYTIDTYDTLPSGIYNIKVINSTGYQFAKLVKID